MVRLMIIHMAEEQECLCNPDLYIEVMNPLWKK